MAADHGFTEAIVAEPTLCEAVLAHRGISSVLLRFKGEAGHASGTNALQANALHQVMHWGANALALVDAEATSRFGGLTGLRFNIGKVEGGIKANMIAPSAEVRFGFRPLPSHDIDGLHERFGGCARTGALERYEETFRGSIAAHPAMSLQQKTGGWRRAISPMRWACRSATRWISGPRPRCSRRPA